MADSIFIWPGASGGSFSGQSIGPAADNTAAPPFTFLGDLDTGLASSAANTLNLVTGGTSALTITATAATFASNVVGAFSRTALGTISTDGLTLTNSTAATGGATVQISPRFRLRGNAWDTSASQTVDFFLENLPATAATPTGTLKFGYSLNGAAATYPMTITSAGNVNFSTSQNNFSRLTPVNTDTSNTSVFTLYKDSTQQFGLGIDSGTELIADGTNGLIYFVTGTTIAGGARRWSIGTTGILSGMTSTSSIGQYKAVTTAGWGVPAIYGYGDVSAATNTGTASIATYTVGAADGTFEVSANCLVTTATTHSFSLDVTYTDEGNTARTMILPIYSLAGTPVTNALIVNTGGTVPYEAPAQTIRAKAATAITVRTSAGGTYTTVTYNARGSIKQIG